MDLLAYKEAIIFEISVLGQEPPDTLILHCGFISNYEICKKHEKIY